MKKIAILGSTGSIGTQTLEVARENGDLQITALAAGNNIELLEKQIREFHPGLVAVWKEEKAKELKDRVKDLDVKVVCRMDGLLEVATEPSSEILVTAIVGMIGIRPTIAAIKAGKDIALANKETLVTAGHIIMPLAKEKGVSILPVDSEHSAIFQCLQSGAHDEIEEILLTASGGPFRDLTAEQIREYRGTLTEPGKESPYRNRSVEENLQLFEEMKNGKYADGEKVLRAKIDMASPNMNMRDPVIYRVAHMSHHNTGDKWCIYPMYDFAHPIEDAIEHITHSICTLEFEDHRPLYDWVVKECEFVMPPKQIEFAKLYLTNVVTGKRYIK